jgi:predicted GNAT family acetyltransferase
MEIEHSTGRFYTKTKHGEAELRYDIVGSVMRIYHTYVPDEERGKGIAKELTDAAFNFAKRSGMKVDPQCPYVVSYLQKYPDRNKQRS